MTDAKSNIQPDDATLLEMVRRMVLIRRAEEQLFEDVQQGRTPGQVHLSDGQEAVAVGLCAHLTDQDQITSTHRGHGHYLAKGGDVKAMFAEIYGKTHGICGGMGGSMHVADFAKGIVGANGIVGAGLGIATGAAFAMKLDEGDRVTLCFFGDGAANQGSLMECMNIAALWQLPILFVCENNGFSEFSPSDTVTSGTIADRAKPFGIPVWHVDGNDILAVWQTGAEAIRLCREGRGPGFIEAQTYRYSGHFSAEAKVLSTPYRTDEEIQAWRAKDPILRAQSLLEERALGDFETIDAEIAVLIDECVAAGQSGQGPEPATAINLMHVAPN